MAERQDAMGRRRAKAVLMIRRPIGLRALFDASPARRWQWCIARANRDARKAQARGRPLTETERRRRVMRKWIELEAGRRPL